MNAKQTDLHKTFPLRKRNSESTKTNKDGTASCIESLLPRLACTPPTRPFFDDLNNK